jgi:hypothetical protein
VQNPKGVFWYFRRLAEGAQFCTPTQFQPTGKNP